MLKVKLLHPNAKLPTCAHPGQDLGYDLYALEDVTLSTGQPVKVRTGVAIEFSPTATGALIRDRSSMAANGVVTSGGVIDATYRGEILILMTFTKGYVALDERLAPLNYNIQAGDKIAQMIPAPALTFHEILQTEELSSGGRGDRGFGSTGK